MKAWTGHDHAYWTADRCIGCGASKPPRLLRLAGYVVFLLIVGGLLLATVLLIPVGPR